MFRKPGPADLAHRAKHTALALTLDVAGVRAEFPFLGGTPDEVILASLHNARLKMQGQRLMDNSRHLNLTPEQRTESQAWIDAHPDLAHHRFLGNWV